ncbi:MAG: hypothetical protein ABEH38_10425 [Flavobacteriales bacterium]
MGFQKRLLTVAGIIFPVLAYSQNGGDQIGGVGEKYDRLNTGTGAFSALYSSKALGVYNRAVKPRSLLEVNSMPSHYEWLHPDLSSRGELFRTHAPAGVTANWRFLQGGNETGRVWSSGQNDALQIRAPQGALHFWSSNTDPAAFQVETMRLWGAGSNGGVSINEDDAVEPMPRIALLNIGSYVGNGQRPWMENGLFAGFASDGLYLGMKAENGDHNDAVLSWNDNADPQYRDHLRFLFTQVSNGGSDAAGPNGLEMGRFDPGNGEERNELGANPVNNGLGLGNFYVPNGTDKNVSTRLDVLTGDVRIRDLPDRMDKNLDRVVVVRPNGVLRVRKLSSFASSDLALKDLKEKLKERKERIERLEARVRALEDSSSEASFGTGKSSSKRKFRLKPLRPNPFLQTTIISFELSEPSKVLLIMSDRKGNRVASLVNGHRDAGFHEERWQAAGKDAGVYYCTLRIDGKVRVRKAIKLE